VQYSADRLRVLGMSERQIKKIGDTRQIPDHVDVVSPTDGLIVARTISKGLRFERQTEFYQIADLSRVWVIAEAFENEAQYFHPGTLAKITLPGQQRTLTARISNIQPEVDPATHTLKLRLEAENPRLALRPNMFVDVEIPVSMPPGLTVPADALVDSGLVQRVFVDRGNGYFEPRAVQVGWRFGDQVQITKGLQAGDQVVSGGTFLVDSESRLKTAGNSHATRAGSDEATIDAHHELSNSGTAKDPNCGMEVDPARAVADGNTVLRDGKRYYFCSRDCRRKFEQDAQRVTANRDGFSHD
jgi:YHS domain-containing protein